MWIAHQFNKISNQIKLDKNYKINKTRHPQVIGRLQDHLSSLFTICDDVNSGAKNEIYKTIYKSLDKLMNLLGDYVIKIRWVITGTRWKDKTSVVSIRKSTLCFPRMSHLHATPIISFTTRGINEWMDGMGWIDATWYTVGEGRG